MLYDDKKFVGNVIKLARKKAGLSQEQLAEKVGMTDKNLSNIENGKQFPQVNNFIRLMEELNLTIENFGSRKTLLSGQTERQETDNELLKLILASTKSQQNAYLKILSVINDSVTGYKD
ncbi:helix-turn-helix transcriptional regulator [bacterium]|nr:helix-turn-helix transcriptional regulator [bacterium]